MEYLGKLQQYKIKYVNAMNICNKIRSFKTVLAHNNIVPIIEILEHIKNMHQDALRFIRIICVQNVKKEDYEQLYTKKDIASIRFNMCPHMEYQHFTEQYDEIMKRMMKMLYCEYNINDDDEKKNVIKNKIKMS